jgi:hypothetical protein
MVSSPPGFSIESFPRRPEITPSRSVTQAVVAPGPGSVFGSGRGGSCIVHRTAASSQPGMCTKAKSTSVHHGMLESWVAARSCPEADKNSTSSRWRSGRVSETRAASLDFGVFCSS